MVWVKGKMHENTLVILLVIEVILWVAVLLIHKYANNYLRIAWISSIIFQTLIVIGCGMLIKKMKNQLQIDVLTNLYNKGFFYTKLNDLRANMPLSLILLDIDNFKFINDQFGHIAGDRILQQLAKILQSNSRKEDIIARWGGEEFAIILPLTDSEEAFKAANRIKKVVASHLFFYENVVCRITVSIGVASAKEGTHTDMEQLLKIADDALYKAKEKKNEIVAI